MQRRAKSLVGAAGFEPATTRTPSLSLQLFSTALHGVNSAKDPGFVGDFGLTVLTLRY
jgi:hypothetical protein